MKLQVALDGTLQASIVIMEKIYPEVDIIEIGTPLVFREGVSVIQKMHKAYPALEILADFKIMDAGYEEASIAFEAGADYVTVLGVAHDKTIQGALQAANEHPKAIVIDMMQVDDFLPRSRTLYNMGCHYLCVHTGFDVQNTNTTPLQKLAQLHQNLPEVGSAIAGGIGLATIDKVVVLKPDIVVIGSAITKVSDPSSVIRILRERIHHE